MNFLDRWNAKHRLRKAMKAGMKTYNLGIWGGNPAVADYGWEQFEEASYRLDQLKERFKRR